MAFGDYATLLSSFSGPNENPLSEGGHWNHGNSASLTEVLILQSHQVTRNTATVFERHYYWTPQGFGPDCEAYITVPTITPPFSNGAQQVDIWLRYSGFDPNSNVPLPGGFAYLLIYQGFGRPAGDWLFQRQASSTATTLGTATQLISAGDKIGFRVVGSTLDAWWFNAGAWHNIMTVTDSSSLINNTGYVAFGLGTNQVAFDDAFAGTIPSTKIPQIYRRTPGIVI